MNTTSKSIFNITTIVTLLIVLTATPSVQPALANGSILVNTDTDNIIVGDGFCTLREAITNANADTDITSGDCVAGSGTDTIIFDENYTITLAGSQLPTVTTEMTIIGNGAANTIIQANADPNTAARVFEVSNTGKLSLDGLTVRNGHCSGPCNSNGYDGGGILNSGILKIANSMISDNAATYGGGIQNEGTLNIASSTMSGNSALYGGGINNLGYLSITGSTFSSNLSSQYGGGVVNRDTLIIIDSTFSDNSASSYDGGGIANMGGSLTLTNSVLSGNSAWHGGGDLQHVRAYHRQ